MGNGEVKRQKAGRTGTKKSERGEQRNEVGTHFSVLRSSAY